MPPVLTSTPCCAITRGNEDVLQDISDAWREAQNPTPPPPGPDKSLIVPDDVFPPDPAIVNCDQADADKLIGLGYLAKDPGTAWQGFEYFTVEIPGGEDTDSGCYFGWDGTKWITVIV